MANFVTVEARDLKRAMKIALDVVERRNTIPILDCVRLRASVNGFRVIATDLDMQAMIHVDTKDRSDALDICIDARRLYEIASAAGAAPMKIEQTADGATITVDGGSAIYTIKTLPAEEYPAIEARRADEIEAFSNGSFAALLKKVKFCISKEETRYYLNGVAWHITPQGRTFAATDGHRLAACRYSGEGAEQPDRIIPRKMVGIITKHLVRDDVKIFATEKANAIDIAAPGLLLRTKLIDGTFPDWTRVVPAEVEFSIKFQRQEIATAIAQATAIGGDRLRGVKFVPGGDTLAVEHDCRDFGKAHVETSAAWPKKAEAFGFNHRYFSAMAQNCETEFEIAFSAPSAPFLFKDSDETMTRVMMPMRV